jgi:hypothetical protein
MAENMIIVWDDKGGISYGKVLSEDGLEITQIEKIKRWLNDSLTDVAYVDDKKMMARDFVTIYFKSKIDMATFELVWNGKETR